MRKYFFIRRSRNFSFQGKEDCVQSSRPQEWQLGDADCVYSLRAKNIQEARAAVSNGTAKMRREPGL